MDNGVDIEPDVVPSPCCVLASLKLKLGGYFALVAPPSPDSTPAKNRTMWAMVDLTITT